MERAMPAHSREFSAIPVWPGVIVMLGIVLLAAGAIIAVVRPVLLVSPQDQINEATHVYAGYLASRNMALALMLLATLILRARKGLNILVLLTAVIQVLDIAMDFAEGRWVVVPAVVIIGALFLSASAGLSGYPFWKKEAWT
jgi:hypothetical protein